MLVVECSNVTKSRFLKAFNTVYCKVGRFAFVKVALGLLRSKCVSILLCATEACTLLYRAFQKVISYHQIRFASCEN